MLSPEIDYTLKRIHSELIKGKEIKKGLMGGNISQILFHYYFNKLYNVNSTIEIENILVENYTNVSDKYIGMNLSSGLSGLVFITNFLISNNIIDENEIDFENMNKGIISSSLNDLSKSNIDYLHGGLGGITCLTYENIEVIDSIIESIYNNRIIVNSTDLTVKNIRSGVYENASNLGLAHGLPSIVICLGKLYKLTTKKDKCLELISGFLSFILKQKNINKNSLYPDTVNFDNEQEFGSRLAWCYGDLGIGSAFWQAGKIFDNQLWKNEALDILIFSAKRKNIHECGVQDACFCHGTSGIAHIFNRFYLETKIDEFDKARRFWINETLKMANWNDNNIGFKTWRNADSGYHDDLGLLEGITGIGLSLLGFSLNNEKDLSWDKCFLLS